MAIDDGLQLAEQIVRNVRTKAEIQEAFEEERRARARRRRRIAGFTFPVFNLLLEDGCNLILEDGTGVYLKEAQ